MQKFITLVFFIFVITACTEKTIPLKQSIPVPTETISKRIDIQYGKPGAPIILTYEMPKKVVSGINFNVDLLFNSSTPQGSLRVNLNTDSGLILLSQSTAMFDLATESKNMSVQLRVSNDAYYYLNIHAKEYDPNGNALLGRSFAVPIQVDGAEKQLKPKGKFIDNDTEIIIEMEAEQL